MKASSYRIAFSILLFAVSAVASAQTFTTLVDFDWMPGAEPKGNLIQGLDGNVYGTTTNGANCNINCGSIFKIDETGSLTTVYTFCSSGDCSDGTSPIWLMLGTNGNIYGSAGNGGIDNNGTVFEWTPEGVFITIHKFDWTDGAGPGGIVEADDGNLYGTTAGGGISRYCPDCGTIFKITRDGKLTTLHDFCTQVDCPDGGTPGDLIQGSDGSLYDTTSVGGKYGPGSIFRITRSGSFATLFSFIKSKGRSPYGGLTQSSDGSFYGTACDGGEYSHGTVFKITPENKFVRLHSFVSNADGFCPIGKLLQASDGNFYGTTSKDGPNGGGTIFSITPDGVLTNLYSFDPHVGDDPVGPLFQATSGTIYGTTVWGGAYGFGTLFTLDVGLGPFVAFMRDSGRVGATGGILGQGFTGTTSVMLNGVPANFTVVSDTFITATVPPGATSGYVTVATPGGMLTSNKPFIVLP
jgi:uncharacterized repeat protein (TIGR03803 family)